MKTIYLSKSVKSEKKWTVLVDNRRVHFGAEGYSDYTIHKDVERWKRYIARHGTNQDWTIDGITTAGFWSRWLIWGEPTLKASIDVIEKGFDVKIVRISKTQMCKKLNC